MDFPTDKGGRDARRTERHTGQPDQLEQAFDTSLLDPALGDQLRKLRIEPEELFLQATEQTRMAICVVDPHAPDEPIVYVNRAFLELTGYERDEVIGRNCRFLQGEDTDPAAVADVRKALDAREVAVVQLLNYRKDGTPMWVSLHIGPVYDAAGKLAYFYGSQWDVTDRVEQRRREEAQQQSARELQHRLQNLFAVISAMVRLSTRGETDASALSQKVIERIDSLGRAHRATIGVDGAEARSTGLRELVEAVVKPYRDVHPGAIELAGEDVLLSNRMVTPIGVALHELATNSMKYGALGMDEGTVAISWQLADNRIALEWHEQKPRSDHPKPTPAPGGGNGSRIVEGVLRSLDGKIEAQMEPGLYRASISVPMGRVT